LHNGVRAGPDAAAKAAKRGARCAKLFIGVGGASLLLLLGQILMCLADDLPPPPFSDGDCRGELGLDPAAEPDHATRRSGPRSSTALAIGNP
jgi:hypothetical protein